MHDTMQDGWEISPCKWDVKGNLLFEDLSFQEAIQLDRRSGRFHSSYSHFRRHHLCEALVEGTNTADAPVKDLSLLKMLQIYQSGDNVIAEAAMDKLNHL